MEPWKLWQDCAVISLNRNMTASQNEGVRDFLAKMTLTRESHLLWEFPLAKISLKYEGLIPYRFLSEFCTESHCTKFPS